MTLPKKLQKELNHTTQAAIPDLLESQGIYKKMAKAVADIGVSVIAFLLSFMIITVIVFIIGRKLDIFSRKPGIHLVNMVFGFFAGVVKAFLVIWVVFFVIEQTKILPVSAVLLNQIEENAVLRGLYEQNLVKEFVLEYFWKS